MTPDLPIITKTYDLIQWYVPVIHRLPRDHKFQLGDRIVTTLYDLLENLIAARYQRDKLTQLHTLNTKLDILRYQTRLLQDFKLLPPKRYRHATNQINNIGTDLGGWIKHQKEQAAASKPKLIKKH
ncbi:MAG: diversity-generating retroelement protein Avd [Cyanobacteria bacterium P01_F01_bin.86]